MSRWTTEYAVYKGDDIFCIGTAEECAEKLKVKPTTIEIYATPSGQARNNRRKNKNRVTHVIRLEDEE